MSTIISAEELTRFLRYPTSEPVDAESTALAENVALGWLSEATGITDWSPETLTQDLTVKAWVLELAGIAYENPTSMENDTAGDVSSQWRDRRSQILKTAEAWARRNGHAPAAAGATSRGTFPELPRRWSTAPW